VTWEYLSTYWKHFGQNTKLRILCVKNENEVIAIAPLKQSRIKFAHLFDYEIISPLAFGAADYTGFLFAESKNESSKLILSYLFDRKDWDFIYFYEFPGTPTNLDLFRSMTHTATKFELEQGAVCPYLSLPTSMDVIMQGLSSKFRKNLRRGTNKLMQDHKRVELKRYDEIGSVEKSMNLFFKLHQKRWKLKGQSGTFHVQERRDFWLALHFLTAEDNPVAALHGYEFNKKIFDALTGFDPSYYQYSVSNILLQKLIEKCITNRIEEFDFLSGDESYKFSWTKTYRRNLNFKILSGRIESNFYDFAFKTLKKTKIDTILKSQSLSLQA
jgi:CelD/BcsL family acetyltransferase involved in cellulose biosynthesis